MSRNLSFKNSALVILNSYLSFQVHLSRPPLFTYPHFTQFKSKTKRASFFNVFSLLGHFTNISLKQLKNATKHPKRPYAMSRICLEQYSSLITKTNQQLENTPGGDDICGTD